MTGSARIGYLDGLRALAVLGVVLYHGAKSTSAAATFLDGRHGVDLFFVISGFCLSYPVLRGFEIDGAAIFDTPLFYAKRLVRIVPPYYAAVTTFIIATVALLLWQKPLPPMMLATGNGDILKQFLFFDYDTRFSNGSFWTLALELRWYLLFPAILWLWINKRGAFWLIMAGAPLLYNFTRLGQPQIGWGIDFATLPAFMGGICAAHLVLRPHRLSNYVWYVLAAALAFELLADNAADRLQDTLGWQIIAFCLVVGIGSQPVLTKAFSWKPLTLIGVASYSIYLYHEPIIGMLKTDAHANWIAATGVALAAGLVMWYLIERVIQIPKHKLAAAAIFERILSPLLHRVDISTKLLFVRSATTTDYGTLQTAVAPKPPMDARAVDYSTSDRVLGESPL